MNDPVFSIITPTCGRPLLLKRNIASVRGQTFPDFEHVIVDDAGDPESARLVRGMQEPRIVFVSHSSPRGASAAYNTGIEKSRGRYVLFLDDDDEYLPEFLRKVHDRIRNTPSSLGFVLTGFTRVLDGEAGERPLFSRVWPSRFPSREDMLLAATSIGNGCGVCVKRECFDRIGIYDESLIVSEDTDFLLKLAGAYDCETVPESLVKIHHHGTGQLTDPKNDQVRRECYRRILERHRELLAAHPRLYALHYRAYVRLCFRVRDKRSGRAALVSILRNTPFRVSNLTDLLSWSLFGKNTRGVFLGNPLARFARFIKHRIRRRSLAAGGKPETG